ncbi:hypothetical protein FA10DRAFT_263648 [Acaromyces ingoldii]|uniref:Transcription factor CBF/NF-Y/archaeal histone domain-containing protein n=1 Tax=Acaromyces ingoldii TaxID=215250 RepID=A0A316YYK0_9BASI|nr:hypothetical protein FA10DRAFT_263648 [Acaromyces ingoldii]PWN92915.1 hypothetical protein FA10DRAFT_263648 [Acaromyces ingoldii]
MKVYQRETMRRMIKSHLDEDQRLSSEADILFFLAYQLFLRRLADEARVRMQYDAAAGITSSKRSMSKRHVVGAVQFILRRSARLATSNATRRRRS